APPLDTKYAGPCSGTGRIGVSALALPTLDATGHTAGLALKTRAVHAFCSVVSRDGSCLGRSTLTERMFACDPNGAFGYVSETCRLAPLALDVFAPVKTWKPGLKPSTAQL